MKRATKNLEDSETDNGKFDTFIKNCIQHWTNKNPAFSNLDSFKDKLQEWIGRSTLISEILKLVDMSIYLWVHTTEIQKSTLAAKFMAT